MRPLPLALLLAATLSARAGAQSAPPRAETLLAPADRVRLAEAFRLADLIGDSVWKGWSAAPFAVLLVGQQREILLRHPHPSPDFVRAGFDSLLATDLFVRPRSFPPTLLATFPAVGGVPTIVIGTARATGKRSTAWVLTLLHEHFHQLQMSRSGYFDGVRALDLARGDETGMWMLNYAFPYDSAVVQARFADLAGALAASLAAPTSGARAASARAVAAARGRLRAVLSPADDRYLAFQMWQEGVARYTELEVARLAAEQFIAGSAFAGLPDYTTYGAEADSLRNGIAADVSAMTLGKSKRLVLYPAGAAVAILLDAAAPSWRDRYLEAGYSLDPLLP